MAKTAKKTEPKRTRFMVSLPEEYRGKLTGLVEKTHRTITAEVQLALTKHLEAAEKVAARIAAKGTKKK